MTLVYIIVGFIGWVALLLIVLGLCASAAAGDEVDYDRRR